MTKIPETRQGALRAWLITWSAALGIAAIFVLWAVSVGSWKQPPETPEETKARLERQAQAQAQAAQSQAEASQRRAQTAQQEAQKSERRLQLCYYKGLCQNFSTARQARATAGNFDTCMSVKLGTPREANIAAAACANDGRFLLAPSDMPTSVECWFVDTSKYKP